MKTFIGKENDDRKIKLHGAHNKHPSTKSSTNVSWVSRLLEKGKSYFFSFPVGLLGCIFIYDSKILARTGSSLIVCGFTRKSVDLAPKNRKK